MCGILANFGYQVEKKDILLIKNRGLDNVGITDFQETNNFFKIEKIHDLPEKFMFQNLHQLVGSTKQPLSNKYLYFAANCEIYNYKKLDENANSDSLVLFNLLSKSLLKLMINDRAELISKSLQTIRDELNKLDGVYSLVIYNRRDNLVFIANDPIGLKPMRFSFNDKKLIVASEGKVIKSVNPESLIENLNGNSIICFDLNDGKRYESNINLNLFKLPNEYRADDGILDELDNLIKHAIEKRIPNHKFGLLFSGGIDSTLIAIMLKKLGADFTCYSAHFVDENMRESPDFLMSREIAKEYDLEFKSIPVDYKMLKKDLGIVAKTIEEIDPIKIGVALPFYYATKLAHQDGVKVIFSGLGSEELFAGYQRHLNILNEGGDVNEECLNGLLNIQFRDLYRDDLITMKNNVELRLPFLDLDLIELSVTIDPKLKINQTQKKIILRDIASRYIDNSAFTQRKKLGAQYGSNFDKAIEKLAKQSGLSKREFIDQLK